MNTSIVPYCTHNRTMGARLPKLNVLCPCEIYDLFFSYTKELKELLEGVIEGLLNVRNAEKTFNVV